MYNLNLGFVWGVRFVKSELDYLFNNYCTLEQIERLKKNLISIGENYEQGAIYGYWIKNYCNVVNLKNELLSLDEIRYTLVPERDGREKFLDNIYSIIPSCWGLKLPEVYFVSLWN